MKSFDRQIFGALLATSALAGCGGGGDRLPPAGAPVPANMVSDTPVLIGEPYEAGGVTYTPADPAHYDEVGYASWYGADLAGRPTARGEAFNPEGISAAHRTLPLPSYVEVTALDTGRTILVRVNDRGPFDPGKIIDLSSGAARQLGILDHGVAAVRVRRVNPNDDERRRLRAGLPVQERLQTSDQLLTALRARLQRGGGMIPPAQAAPDVPSRPPRTVAVPPPVDSGSGAGVTWQQPATPAPPPPPPPPPAASGTYFVQLGAFGNPGNADRLAGRARSAGLGEVRVVTSGNLRLVQVGPFPTAAAAQAAQDRASRAGFGEGRIVR